MKPYYQDECVTIYNKDCRGMSEVVGESVNLLFTDPVYGNFEDYELLLACSKLLKSNAPLLVWSGVRFLDKTLDILREEYHYRGLFAFVNQTTGHMVGKMINKTHFLIWVDKDKQSKMYGYLPNGYISVGWKREHNYHRWVKNPKFISLAIAAFSEPNSVILDPFMGSGTVAYCAKQLNRRYIGYEIEEKYCKMATDRCRQAVMKFGI